jgi:hypothetical protein
MLRQHGRLLNRDPRSIEHEPGLIPRRGTRIDFAARLGFHQELESQPGTERALSVFARHREQRRSHLPATVTLGEQRPHVVALPRFEQERLPALLALGVSEELLEELHRSTR